MYKLVIKGAGWNYEPAERFADYTQAVFGRKAYAEMFALPLERLAIEPA